MAVFVPVVTPFNCQIYSGVWPGLVALAVKFTWVPAQLVSALAAMLTLAGTLGVTVTITALLVAVAGEAQARLDVSRQRTTSLFARLVVVNVDVFPPEPDPLTCH